MSPPVAADRLAMIAPEAAVDVGAARSGVARRALLLVACFWWVSTGAIFALQRTPATRLVALVLSSALAVVAAILIFRTRDQRSARAAGIAFLAGGVWWAWVTNALFGGWLVGPAGVRATRPGPSLGLALEALHATAYAELAAGAAVVAAFVIVRGRPNRAAATGLLTLWGTQQLAKLNIFVGVANPGERFLSEPLRFLAEFFGPAENSLLLPISVLLLTALTVHSGRRALEARDPGVRFARALVTALLALAVVEHLVLGIHFDIPLWEVFLRIRGS